jgi:prophage regulatory protein
MAAQTQAPLTILRRRQVEQRTGLSRSTIYGKIKPNPKRLKEYDPTFPLPITLGNGAKAVGWVESEINAWLSAQVENSRKITAKG